MWEPSDQDASVWHTPGPNHCCVCDPGWILRRPDVLGGSCVEWKAEVGRRIGQDVSVERKTGGMCPLRAWVIPRRHRQPRGTHRARRAEGQGRGQRGGRERQERRPAAEERQAQGFFSSSESLCLLSLSSLCSLCVTPPQPNTPSFSPLPPPSPSPPPTPASPFPFLSSSATPLKTGEKTLPHPGGHPGKNA